MERDFMGLNSKDTVVVKEEFVEGGCEDSGFARNAGNSWPSSNKVSTLPQFMSLKCEQDENSSENGHSAHPIHDTQMHPFSMMSPFLKTHFIGGCQSGAMKQQFHGGNPHSVLPSAASVAGTTEQWISSKASGVPAQLTIFYRGTVNVFDDISPEKAQAIILLAGNAFVQSNMTQSKLHMQGPASKHPAADQKLVNTPPCSGLPSPMSVSSYPIDRSGAKTDDIKVSTTAGISTTLVKAEPPRIMSSIGSVAACAIISSAVPQARKASLARFLEKRKERVMNASPYKLSSKTADCATPETNDFAFSATSGICSSSLSVNKDTD